MAFPRSLRLERSIQRLNKSVLKLEHEYKKNAARLLNWSDSTIAEMLDKGAQETDVFDRAAAFTEALSADITRRKTLSQSTTVAKTICVFVARMFPLVRVLLEIGGTAAQVSEFSFFLVDIS